MVFHNLKGYDAHHIIRETYQAATEFQEKRTKKDKNGQPILGKNGEPMTYLWKPKLGCIPNSYEKFMSFSIGDIKFIDSCQFLAESLDSLVKNLHDKSDKYKNFHFMKKEYPQHY